MRQMVPAAALLLCVAACSPESPDAAGVANASAPPAAAAPDPSTAVPAEAPAASNVLTPEGLGGLRIGAAVPAGSSWAERGAQIPGTGCRTVSSPDFPGAYAIVEGGTVRRITVGQRSDVKLAQGFGVGASEAEVRAAFPAFREEPHKYIEAPGKYLTAPEASNGRPALRFEIGADRKVQLIHAGTMPVLGYVEGCA